MLKTSPERLFRLAEMQARRIDVANTATWQLGDGGPRILMIHGFRGDHHGLLGVAGAMPEARFVIPDLPGFGKTKPLTSKHDLAGYSQWLREFVSEAGKFDAVLAHSFGTLVLSKALSDGLAAERVLLQNPITSQTRGAAGRVADYYYQLGSKPESNLLRSATIVRGMSIALTTTKRPTLRRFIHRQHANYFSTYADNRVVSEGYQAASSSNVLDYAEHMPNRLRIVAGEKDVVAPLAGQQKLAQITGAPLRVINKVGHLTHYETPAEVAEELAKLLEG